METFTGQTLGTANSVIDHGSLEEILRGAVLGMDNASLLARWTRSPQSGAVARGWARCCRLTFRHAEEERVHIIVKVLLFKQMGVRRP